MRRDCRKAHNNRDVGCGEWKCDAARDGARGEEVGMQYVLVRTMADGQYPPSVTGTSVDFSGRGELKQIQVLRRIAFGTEAAIG